MEYQLSAPFAEQLRKSIRAETPPDIGWEYNDQLSDSQINKILTLPDGLCEVEMELMENNWEYISDLQMDQIRSILRRHIETVATELGQEIEELSDEELENIILENDLLSAGPGVDLQLYQLFKNTRPRIVLQMDLHHEHQGYQWEDTLRYEGVEQILRLFQINPRAIHRSFPNLAFRNGREYILPKDLRELWDNAANGGQYVVPIDLDLWKYQQHSNHYHTGIILHKGDEIWLHDYGCGSGSISIPLQRDLTILKRDVDYHFVNDRDKEVYGLDAVYGLSQSAWCNRITPINKARAVRRAIAGKSLLKSHKKQAQ